MSKLCFSFFFKSHNGRLDEDKTRFTDKTRPIESLSLISSFTSLVRCTEEPRAEFRSRCGTGNGDGVSGEESQEDIITSGAEMELLCCVSSHLIVSLLMK